VEQQDYVPARIADRAEIRDVMYRWCRAIDRLDYEAMRSVYHPDAHDNHGPGHYEGDVTGLIEWIRSRHGSIPFCLHSLSNMLIEFAGPDIAIVETNIMTAQQYPEDGDPVVKLSGNREPGKPVSMIAFARYADRFERKEGRWLIQHRVVIMDAQMLFETVSGKLASGIVLGRRNRDDYIYKLRSEAGLPN
jgi:hypothetical protein